MRYAESVCHCFDMKQLNQLVVFCKILVKTSFLNCRSKSSDEVLLHAF